MILHIHAPNPLIAIGVLASTAATDAAFAVISYTGNAVYVLFAAAGSWLGAYGAVTWLGKSDLKNATGTPRA